MKEESVPPRTLKPNLYDVAPAALDAALSEFVSPPFRLRQIAEWLFDRGVSSFDEMTNIPLDLRVRLAERFDLDSLMGGAS